ncbi:MAG: CDP-alcohol phosphatidyltransferase family protein, partial [Rhodobacteraceae bacterium]|nr:CDP-alcohol phosphatidyltransferase family protein [Paracoccaceae bacterium]
MLTLLVPGLVQLLFLILAAATIQARLVCNLIDGMVAVEGGQGTKDGPFWNEAPDRASDLLFLLGAGIAAGNPAL